MKKYLVIALMATLVLSLIPISAKAQGQLRVRISVLDQETKEPITGAQMVAYQPARPNNKWNDVSDEEGVIVLVGMQPGQVVFEIIADGYQKGRFVQRLPSNRPRIEMNIELAPIVREKGQATPEIVAEFNVGIELSKEGKHEEALAVFEELIEKYPDIKELYVAAVTEYIELEQYEKAVGLLEKMLEDDPENTDLMVRLAAAYTAAGQNEEAGELYVQIVEKNPEDLFAIEQVAFSNYQAGNFQMAKEYYLRALELNPDNPIANYYLGNIFYVEDNFEEALKHYNNYIELDPNNQTGGVEAAKATIEDIKKRMEAQNN